MSSKMPRKSLTPAEEMARRKIARRRLRALIREVYDNRYWLGEFEETRLSENVTRNILLLTKKTKILSSLTMYEKSILRKPTAWRTVEERKQLNKVIGGLKYFRRYPPEVKAALAAVTFFEYYPPGRTLIRQNHEPTAMYFLLSGEASVEVSHYDKFLKEWISENTGVLGPGSTFGDVSLLHNIKRMATYITATHCELLVIKKDDFHSIIRDYVLEDWNQIQAILDKFTYFKNWDSVTKREASILTKMKTYKADEIILGDAFGSPPYVHFITKGSACLIENIQVHKCNATGVDVYKLTVPEEISADRLSTITQIFYKYRKYVTSQDTQMSSELHFDYVPFEDMYIFTRSPSQRTKESRSFKKSISPLPSTLQEMIKLSKTHHDSGMSSIFSETFSKELHIHRNRKVECREQTHFMKVCEYLPGACFSVGEKFERRRIVAMTPVTCLLLPRYWILRNNKDEVWTRVTQFLDRHIPNTREIFKQFVHEQKFKKYKKRLIRDILNERAVDTGNSIHNVPYSIRMQQGVDTDYFR
ncbi:cyclic nucleotide-binding domain-containing protein 2-like [Diabrotica virgifera virgifera]|uniref:Cyclic nucleotide-binding domain-containing protein n=2 Tax=Diabrotica virgifera virgifera TaxID=50390 RepID=A0ABM5KDC7_DIAVI|nr:cyclic nucleotide-binding domain-containing protein 2-like [Diabrotica virgifera virgifera]